MRQGIHEALTLLAQAGVFFGRHYPVIVAFCAPVALQRFMAVGGAGERFGSVGSIAGSFVGELMTIALRLGLLAWLVGRLFRGVSRADASGRLSHFFEGHTAMLLTSLGILVLLAALMNAGPAVLRSGLDESSRKSLLAWELAIKNLTVIPFVIVWVVLIARMALGEGEPLPRD